MTEGDEQLQRALAALRARYLAESPQRIADLRATLELSSTGDLEALAELRLLFHRLAGSGGAYGFDRVTDCARAGEHETASILDTGAAPSPAQVATLASHIDRVAAAFRSDLP